MSQDFLGVSTFCKMYRVSKEKPDLCNILFSDYQSNSIQNCLVSSLMCSIRFSNIPVFKRSLFPVNMGDLKAPFKSDNNDRNFSSVFLPSKNDTYMYQRIFCPLGRLESPWISFHTRGEDIFIMSSVFTVFLTHMEQFWKLLTNCNEPQTPYFGVERSVLLQ